MGDISRPIQNGQIQMRAAARIGYARAIQTSDRLGIGMLALAMVPLCAIAWRLASAHGTPLVDDAYIALIYARNLSEGSGLTYTDGSRVEGYTDFLWVLMAAGGIKGGIDPVVLLQCVSFLSALGLIVAVWVWTQRYSQAPPYLRFAPILLGCSSWLAFWAGAGLETTFFTLLLLIATMVSARATSLPAFGIAGCLYCVGALTHPDGALWVVVSAACLFFPRTRGSIALIASFAIPFALYWAWRSAYFGDFLPNTAHAKDTWSPHQIAQGLDYVVTGGLPQLIAIPIVAVSFGTGLWRRFELTTMLAQICVWTAYVVYLGGDALLAFRFWVPVLPLSCILLQESAAAFMSTSVRPVARRALTFGTVATVFAASVLPAFAGSELSRIQMDGRHDGSRVDLGRWFAAHSMSDDLIAVNAAGAIPYFARRPAIDMLGLNDRHIARFGAVDDLAPVAHKRSDADYVLDRRPAFIVLTVVERGQPIAQENVWLQSDRGLIRDPRLHADYVRVAIPALEGHEIVFARRDRAVELLARGDIMFVLKLDSVAAR